MRNLGGPYLKELLYCVWDGLMQHLLLEQQLQVELNYSLMNLTRTQDFCLSKLLREYVFS
ncbi:hypothetical protein AXY04_11885 [Enterobacter asburiae]|nr:hypothetical protein AXY04_11885 [Enterobacter asburiae]